MLAGKTLEEVHSVARCSQDRRSHELTCMVGSNERGGIYATVGVISRLQNGWSIVTVCVWRRVKPGAPAWFFGMVVRSQLVLTEVHLCRRRARKPVTVRLWGTHPEPASAQPSLQLDVLRRSSIGVWAQRQSLLLGVSDQQEAWPAHSGLEADVRD